MKKIITVFVLLSFFSCKTNSELNKVIYDKEVKQKILIGKIDRNGLKSKKFKTWFEEEYNSYQPDVASIKHLKNFIPDNAKITIVLATWCSDSRREVPRFYKILDQIGFDENKVTIYAVDKIFQSLNFDIKDLKIEKVPTFIYYHYGYEAGRIVETPKESLEKDLVDFTKRKGKN
jgi:thiol-disulfide isomerase/thioredoxin